ncbi:MAG: histidine phosphatase family protein [Gammaproteobacteria bacterium]|nr:histidine phosphatase family protein [Gammaproteobacteria bacterium]
MKLYFMRHGQTNYNTVGLCNDDPSRDVHLNETGLIQAQTAAEQLKPVPLEKIIVSELPRTHETARIINQYHQVPIEVVPQLNDIRSGFDSQPVADYFAAIAADPLHITPAGGESLLSHKQRIVGYLQSLTTIRHSPILFVVHEETLRVVMAFFEALSDEAMLQLHFGNCEILEFDIP